MKKAARGPLFSCAAQRPAGRTRVSRLHQTSKRLRPSARRPGRRFPCQFLQRHVHGRAEDGGGADEAQHAEAGAELERHHHAQVLALDVQWFRALGHRVAAQFLQQSRQPGVAGGLDLLAQPLEQVAAPLGQVDDVRRQALRVQAQPQHVHRRLQERRIGAGQQVRQHAVGRDQVPVPVHGQGGIGLVALEDQFHRLPRGSQRGIVERAFAVHRRVAGGHQQGVALAQRHVQPFGQPQHHLAAGQRAAGFHEAQVPRRDVRFLRQVELAQAPVLAPVAQVVAEGLRCGTVDGRRGDVHAPHGSATAAPRRITCGVIDRPRRRGQSCRPCPTERSSPCRSLLRPVSCAMCLFADAASCVATGALQLLFTAAAGRAAEPAGRAAHGHRLVPAGVCGHGRLHRHARATAARR